MQSPPHNSHVEIEDNKTAVKGKGSQQDSSNRRYLCPERVSTHLNPSTHVIYSRDYKVRFAFMAHYTYTELPFPVTFCQLQCNRNGQEKRLLAGAIPSARQKTWQCTPATRQSRVSLGSFKDVSNSLAKLLHCAKLINVRSFTLWTLKDHIIWL